MSVDIRKELIPDGPKISHIVAGMMHLGSWQMSTEELIQWIEAAIEMGVTTFDHADIYGGYTCEAIFGKALKQAPSLRERMEIITKCGIALISPNRSKHRVKHYDTSMSHIVQSVDRSLANLNTDFIDILLIHRPDPLMDVDEVAEAFSHLAQAGKVKAFGVSNFTPYQIDALHSRVDMPLVTNQVQFSPLHLSPMHDGTFDHAQQHRYTPMAWSPLAGGRIFHDDSVSHLRHVMGHIAASHDAGVDQIALAWLMAHPTRPIPVMGTGKRERLASAVLSMRIELSRQEWFRIWEASMGYEVP